MKPYQLGSVLIVSLLLLLVITIVGISGILNTMSNERLASNQRQVTEAFMAAETGLVEAKKWLDENRILWGKTEESLTLLNEVAPVVSDNVVSWYIKSLVYKSGVENIADVTSCGKIDSTGVERCVAFSYIQAKGTSKLAALSLIGKAIDFLYGDTGNITFDGDGGFAIALNDDSNAENLVDIKTELDGLQAKVDSGIELTGAEKQRLNRLLQRYVGGIEKVDFGDPFGSPEKLDVFVNSIKSDFCSCRTTASYCQDKVYTPREGLSCSNVGYYNSATDFDIGKAEVFQGKKAPAVPKLVYIESLNPANPVKLTLSGNETGAGILVIKGTVLFSGTPNYDGLLLVVGGKYEIGGGGGGGVTGALVVTNIEKDEDNKPVFGDVVVDLTKGTGTSDYFYNEELLRSFHAELLSSATKPLWKVDEDGEELINTQGTIFGWKEVVNL